jgi:peptide/nickel transport system substrate-binding protein
MSVSKVITIASSALLLTALSGPGVFAAHVRPAGTSNSGPKYGGTLNVGVDSDFVTLDPALSSALIDRQALINIFDPLLKLSPTMQVKPNLVTHWSITNGGKTYTLYLRHGVKFQDGTPFNAQAVVYNWKWEMNPKNASPRISDLTLVKSLATPNPYEVVVNLSAPYTPFLSVLAGRTGMISSPTAMKKEGKNYPEHPVGTGPFEVVSWNPEGNLVLKKNPYYWQKGKPYLNKVVYTPIVQPTQEYDALLTGQEDLIDSVPYQDVDSVKSQPGIHSEVMNGLGTTSLELNTTYGPLKNYHNRSAINYAINRKALINLIFFGHTKPAYSQYPPSSWAYNPNLKIPYSLADAKKQLKLAGDPHGFTVTLQMENDTTDEQMGEAIASELAKVGITVKLEPLDFTTLLTNAVDGNYEFNILGWSGRPDPDQNSYAFDTTGGSFNYPKYSNPEVNKFLLEAREAPTESQRKILYNDAAKIILQQAPYIFIAYTPVIQAWSNKVEGYREYPDDLMRLTDVWLK